MSKEHNYSISTAVLQHQRSTRNGCVLFVPFACDCHGYVAHKSVHILVGKVLIMWPIWNAIVILEVLQSDWCHQHSSNIHENRSKSDQTIFFSPECLAHKTTLSLPCLPQHASFYEGHPMLTSHLQKGPPHMHTFNWIQATSFVYLYWIALDMQVIWTLP